MLGTYFGATALRAFDGLNIWVTALGAGIVVAAIGGLFERLVLTRLKANPLGQVLVTLGMSFIISDACLALWGGDSIPVPTPQNLQSPTRVLGFVFPTYRLVLVGCAIGAAIMLYFLMERTRLGAMIRAGVDDRQMARAVGIPVSNLFTIVFCLGTGIAGAGDSRAQTEHDCKQIRDGDSDRACHLPVVDTGPNHRPEAGPLHQKIQH